MQAATDNAVLKKMVPLARITEDHAIQVRGGVNPARVKEYEQILGEHGFMDVVDVFYEEPLDEANSAFLLADGFHRLAAYRTRGIDKVPCRLHPGNRSDAIRLALKKNGHHGAPLTNAEKRAAAGVAVLDPVVGELSDREIARLIGCSPTLVSEARRGITPPMKAEEKRRRTPGKAERESAAPREATARQRKPAGNPNRPTQQSALKSIETLIEDNIIEEADILEMFATKDGEYRFVDRPGGVTRLKVIGKTGRVQADIEVVVKQIGLGGIVVKFETGKLAVED